ncbi:DUF1328 domain-containing protein [Pantoea sp. 1B4]|nr:DUF1328 domain-containing protein [Pantoea sp. 1B4]
MFRWGIIFLVIALIAAALGFGGLAGTAAWAAKVVFVVGIILFLISLFTGRKKALADESCSVMQRKA